MGPRSSAILLEISPEPIHDSSLNFICCYKYIVHTPSELSGERLIPIKGVKACLETGGFKADLL